MLCGTNHKCRTIPPVFLSQINKNMSELQLDLTFHLPLAIISHVDSYRCRRPLGGTSKQLNGIKIAVAPLESLF